MPGAVVVVALTAGCSGGGGASGDLNMLTYNVAGLPQEISQANPEEHIPLISPLLNDYDVVLTQEDFDWWGPLLDGLDFANYHERLRAETTHPYASDAYPGPQEAGLDVAARPTVQVGDGLGVLSRYVIVEQVRVPWPGCFGQLNPADGGAADCLASKGFAKVTLALTEDPADDNANDDVDNSDADNSDADIDDDAPLLDVYTLHAEAGATDEDQRLQEEDFTLLADYVAEHSAGRAVIVAGDTNLHTDGGHPDAHGEADAEAWAQFLDVLGLDDACAELDCGEPDAVDKVAYRDGRTLDLSAETISFPRERFTDDDGVDLSDHPPLAVKFRWKVTEA